MIIIDEELIGADESSMRRIVKSVRFSQHALQKFDVFAEYGFQVSEEDVIETLRSPDHIDLSKSPPIAQRRMSENTVLRVVYTEYVDEYFVITFYPGKRSRYED